MSTVLKQYKALEPHLVARIFHRLAKGLAASHHVGVIHRDLKPSNVISVAGLLVSDVKITDFGIAKMAEAELKEAWVNDESLTASQTAIGALPYMAPEMIKSVKDVTTATDVWSLGALVFELLSGKKPFGAGLPAVHEIMQGKMPSYPQICLKRQFDPLAQEIYSVLTLCLTKDALTRPTADTILKKCEDLCYIESPRELGVAKQMNNAYWGFVRSDAGDDVFFHRDSLFGGNGVAAGQNVAFVRHKGGGSDRAFPIQVYS